MRVEALEVLFHGGRVIPAGTILDLNELRAKEMINAGLAMDLKPKEDHKKKSEWFCVASGGSLTKGDCEAVEKWKAKDPEQRGIIVVNNTYQLFESADALVALDKAWWDIMKPEFNGEKYHLKNFPIKYAMNSGLAAMQLARYFGAKTIYLLGYDLKVTDGKKHWHGDHKKGLGNATSMNSWLNTFANKAHEFATISVVNCTRSTALNIYPLKDLEDVINNR